MKYEGRALGGPKDGGWIESDRHVVQIVSFVGPTVDGYHITWLGNYLWQKGQWIWKAPRVAG